MGKRRYSGPIERVSDLKTVNAQNQKPAPHQEPRKLKQADSLTDPIDNYLHNITCYCSAPMLLIYLASENAVHAKEIVYETMSTNTEIQVFQ